MLKGLASGGPPGSWPCLLTLAWAVTLTQKVTAGETLPWVRSRDWCQLLGDQSGPDPVTEGPRGPLS